MVSIHSKSTIKGDQELVQKMLSDFKREGFRNQDIGAGIGVAGSTISHASNGQASMVFQRALQWYHGDTFGAHGLLKKEEAVFTDDELQDLLKIVALSMGNLGTVGKTAGEMADLITKIGVMISDRSS